MTGAKPCTDWLPAETEQNEKRLEKTGRAVADDPGRKGTQGGPPSSVLKHLIREVEESSGYTRNDARAKAKAWLVENVTSLGENEIFLAKTHFSYLLPADWGAKAKA